MRRPLIGTAGTAPSPVTPTPTAPTPTPAAPTPSPFVWNATEDQWSYEDPADNCNAEVQQVRHVSCIDSSSGAVVDDAQCAGAKPDEIRTASNMSGCTYTWTFARFSAYDSNCSQKATRVAEYECLRSDPELTPVDGSNCAGEAPYQAEEDYIDSGCTYRWADTAAWNASNQTLACEGGQTVVRVQYGCMDAANNPVGLDKCENVATGPGRLSAAQSNRSEEGFACEGRGTFVAATGGGGKARPAVQGTGIIASGTYTAAILNTSDYMNRCLAAANAAPASTPIPAFCMGQLAYYNESTGEKLYAWSLRKRGTYIRSDDSCDAFADPGSPGAGWTKAGCGVTSPGGTLMSASSASIKRTVVLKGAAGRGFCGAANGHKISMTDDMYGTGVFGQNYVSGVDMVCE